MTRLANLKLLPLAGSFRGEFVGREVYIKGTDITNEPDLVNALGRLDDEGGPILAQSAVFSGKEAVFRLADDGQNDARWIRGGVVHGVRCDRPFGCRVVVHSCVQIPAPAREVRT